MTTHVLFHIRARPSAMNIVSKSTFCILSIIVVECADVLFQVKKFYKDTSIAPF
jgi:hypothetical protein